MFSAPSSGSGSVDAFPGHGSPDADGRDTRYHPEVEEDIEGDYCFVPDIKETLSAAAQDASFPETRPAAVYGSESGDDSHSAKIMSSRAYQLEMLNQSLKHNVIVAVCHQEQLSLVSTCPSSLTRSFIDGHRKWQNPSVS